MRRFSDEPPEEQIHGKLAEVLCLLGQVGVQIRTEEGRSLRWMEQSVDCAFADTDRILRQLEGR